MLMSLSWYRLFPEMGPQSDEVRDLLVSHACSIKFVQQEGEYPPLRRGPSLIIYEDYCLPALLSNQLSQCRRADGVSDGLQYLGLHIRYPGHLLR